MRNRIWILAVLPVLLVMAGCGYDAGREQEINAEKARFAAEQARYMAQQPPLNGSNAGWIAFFVCLAAVAIVACLCAAFAYVRAARHESLAKIRQAEEGTRQAEVKAAVSRISSSKTAEKTL